MKDKEAIKFYESFFNGKKGFELYVDDKPLPKSLKYKFKSIIDDFHKWFIAKIIKNSKVSSKEVEEYIDYRLQEDFSNYD